MDNILLKSISPQAVDIYRLLENGQQMSSKEISKSLKIFPNAVYRAVKQLLELGFVEEVRQYPVKFKAKPLNETVELYSSIIRLNFQQTFGYRNSKTTQPQLLQVTFIRTRTELFGHLNQDIKNANNAINIIASGLEVPAEHILALKKAMDKRVKVRALVQRLDEVSEEMFNNWQKIGVEVKYYPNMEARIFVIDKQVVYFTSYNPKEKEEAIGMSFVYPPYALLMNELFEQRWRLGKEINGDKRGFKLWGKVIQSRRLL